MAWAAYSTPVLLMPDSQDLQSLLNRPPSERLREYKYRLAQCAIFGLPVLALHLFGPKLGGPESSRWIGLLQALLAGWCLYIGAVPTLFEGVLLIANRKLRTETLIALVAFFALLIYVIAFIYWIMTLTGHPRRFTALFACAVLLPILGSMMGLLQYQSNNHRR